jgi:Icc-related predicted phosphoesterase
VIRIAAAGDVHFGTDSAGTLRPHIESFPDRADIFLLAGDLTKGGEPEEAAILAAELADLPIPTVAVLGNHDYHADRQDDVVAELRRAGVRVLESDSIVLEIAGARLGIAGAKGFGGGFAGACGSEFGERQMKDFVGHTRAIAGDLERCLAAIDADVRVLLLHYSPVRDTLRGEPLEIYPFLGSYLFAELADHAGVDLILHGHAHRGTEKGLTAGGIHVRNVAQTVIRQAYATYELEPRGRRREATAASPLTSAADRSSS